MPSYTGTFQLDTSGVFLRVSKFVHHTLELAPFSKQG